MVAPRRPAPPAPPPAAFDAALAAAAGFARASRAPATLRGYRSDWADFAAWCARHGQTSLPAGPQTVAVYLADRAAVLKTATLKRRLAAIAVTHRQAGHALDLADPLLADVWSGIRRTLGTASAGKAALLPADLRQIVELLPDSVAGRRDRAVLLLGFAGAFRRSELVGLDVDDLAHHAAGLIVTLRRGKSDPEGRSTQRAIPRGQDPATCPVRAVQAWLVAARLGEGPLLRPVDRFDRVGRDRLAPRAVARIVKRSVAVAAEAQGLPAAAVAARVAAVAGHSLRAGLVTAALLGGAEEASVMRQTGHRSRRSLHGYVRLSTLWADNAATRIGL